MRSLFLVALLASFAPTLRAQQPHPVEVVAAYNFVRTNAPPSGCGCFNLQGGGGAVLWNVSRSFEPLFKVSVTHADAIDGSTSDLTLTSYLFGVRSALPLKGRLVPYGEFAIGPTHATGTLITRNNSGATTVVGATVGGGLRLRLTPHFDVQAVQADYYVTQVPNLANGHQNNLLLTSGVIVRF